MHLPKASLPQRGSFGAGKTHFTLNVRAHTMKAQILTFLIILAIGCTSEQSNKLSGIWDATNYMKYPSDTIMLEDDFDPELERTTVKTDSGIMVISHLNDSIIGVAPTTRTNVLQFHFDNGTQGVLSIYDIDSEKPVSDNDPRYYANNYNFWTLTSNGRTYLVLDYHFNQFGRAVDTVEYELISANQLIIKGDTLNRINEP